MHRKTPRQAHEEALGAAFWPTPVRGIGDAPLVATLAGGIITITGYKTSDQ
jgi:hypothetical protein